MRLALALAFTALLAANAPWHQAFLPDDEGYELMKAWLLQRGHPLYGEIWSDQPPLHTWILSAAFRLFGTSIATGRAVALAFTALALWTLATLVGRRHGQLLAALALLALVLSPGFTRLAASATIMLPALAVALLGVVLLPPALRISGGEHLEKPISENPAPMTGTTPAPAAGRGRLFLAGVVFGLALQIKFIALIILPLVLCEFARQLPGGKPWPRLREFLRRLAVWTAGAALAFATVLALCPDASTAMLWSPHLSAATRATFAPGGPRLHATLRQDADVLALVGAGLLLGLVRRRLDYLPPLFLFLVAYVGHSWLRPFWGYYYLHLALPLAWLTALATGDLVAWTATAQRTGALLARFVLTAALLANVLAHLPERLEKSRAGLRGDVLGAPPAVLQILRDHAGAWAFADPPALAFQAGVPVPPEAAVLSQKRIRLGLFTEADFLRCLEKRRPGVVVLGAAPVGEAARAYLAEHYEPATPANITGILRLRRPPTVPARP